MKITIKQYAESLYVAVKAKKDSDIKNIIKNFVILLKNNYDISKADLIIEKFTEVWNKNNNIVEAEIISAKEMDNKIFKLLNDYIIKLSGAKKTLIDRRVNKNILGGFIIKYEDKILDGSLTSVLNSLKENIIK